MSGPTPAQLAVVRKGLAQLPRSGLEELKAFLDAGGALCLDGAIVNSKGDP